MSKLIIKISLVHLCPGSSFHHYLPSGFHAVQFSGYLFSSLYPASSFSGDSAAYIVAPARHLQLLLGYWCQWLMKSRVFIALFVSISLLLCDFHRLLSGNLAKHAHFTIFTIFAFYLASLNLAEICNKYANYSTSIHSKLSISFR